MATPKTKDDFIATIATKGKVGKTVTGNIETANDVDWFKFDASKFKGDLSTIKFSGDAHLLSLYDSQGLLIPNGINNSVATLKTPGVYYVGVSGAAGKYNFSTAILNDDFGANISTASAFKGSSMAGKIENAGDIDVFKTSLKSGNTYDFSVIKFAADKATLSLLDKTGKVVATDSDHDGKITFNSTSNADYYVSIAGVSQNTGDYKITSMATKSNAVTSGTKTTYDLYSHSPENGGTYVVDAGTGAFKFVIDMKKISHTVVAVVKNFGADDSLYISNGWDKNLSMLRVADSGTIGQYQEHIQVTQPFSMQNLIPEFAEIWLGNLPAEVGEKIQAIGTASIKEFNALSVGDIFWS
jgi:hypothetical protein